jgi:hypothetical protein
MRQKRSQSSEAMKHILLAVILLPSVLIAQSTPRIQSLPMRQIQPGQPLPSTDTLPDNYQITLTITDKDGQPIEISLVAASTRFNASFAEQGLSLEGLLTIEESGSTIVQYSLGWTTPTAAANGIAQVGSSNMTGSVRLKLGEEIQIIRVASRVARLSIKKLESSKAK